MRELERDPSPPLDAPLDAARSSDTSDTLPLSTRIAVIGSGRVGSLLAAELRDRVQVTGPLDRSWPELAPALAGADAVLLAVPDGTIASVAAAIPAGPRLGHLSGATGLAPLGARDTFSVHPLMTISGSTRPSLHDVPAAVDGSSAENRHFAAALARTLGLRPFAVAEADRVAYHAAASIAANFLITVQAAAEELAATAGVSRAAFVPLVRAAVENWAATGPRAALTGPIARGDAATVARQRAAVAERTPALLALWDAVAAATARLAGTPG